MSFTPKEKRRLKISYFASLREQRGLSSEEIESMVNTAEELYLELKERYNFSLEARQLKVAINAKYKDMNTSLNSGDEVVFIPPVAGG